MCQVSGLVRSSLCSRGLAVCSFLVCNQRPRRRRPSYLRGGKLLTITHGVIENGVVVIEDGKIAAVGAGASVKVPAGAQVIDVTGMTVYPGLIDSETNLGAHGNLGRKHDQRPGRAERRDHAAHAHGGCVSCGVGTHSGGTNERHHERDRGADQRRTLCRDRIHLFNWRASADEMLLVRDIAIAAEFYWGANAAQGRFRKAKVSLDTHGLAAQLRQAFLDAQDYEGSWADYDKKKDAAAQGQQAGAAPLLSAT